jgi:hypothetical protein
MLGCDIVMAGPPCPADQAAAIAPVIMAVAERINATEESDEQKQ